MKDNITKKRLLMNKIFTCFGLLLLISCLCLAIYDYILEQKAINASATIISLEYDNNKTKATVRYKVEDQTYEQKIYLPKGDNSSVKDQTKIKYDLNNPNKLINNNHEILIAVCILVSLFILLFNLPKFISNTKDKSRINKLYKKGSYLTATITDVFVDNNGKKYKKTLPYKLRCKYLNPANKTEYVFESKDTFVNPKDIMTKYNINSIIVLIDKNKPSNYYVDLDSLVPQIKIVDPTAFLSHKADAPNNQTDVK